MSFSIKSSRVLECQKRIEKKIYKEGMLSGLSLNFRQKLVIKILKGLILCAPNNCQDCAYNLSQAKLVHNEGMIIVIVVIHDEGI